MNHREKSVPSLFPKLVDQLRALGLSCYAFGGERALALAKEAGTAAVRAYGLDEGQGLCMVALPLDVFPQYGSGACPHHGDADSDGPDLLLEVAAFAAANHYAAIVRTLSSAARLAGLSRARVFCNSRLAEKPLAALLGLGHIGRSSLLVTPEYGSAVLLAGLVLPEAPPSDLDASLAWDAAGRPMETAMAMGALCGSCDACVEACPTGAIDRLGGLNLGLCLQKWASSGEEPPVEVAGAWGARLYGCDECTKACPASARAAGFPGLCSTTELRPGRFVRAGCILNASDGELTSAFRGTALGMKRFAPELWRKNARLARAWVDRDGGVKSHGR